MVRATAAGAGMGIFQTISDFLDARRYGDLSQSQTEAFIDALTFAMIVDGDVAEVEEDELAEALDEFDWDGQMPLEVHVDTALDRAEACIDDEERASEYCRDIADRLDDAALEREVYYLSAEVACADEVIRESERVLLQHLVDAFDLERDQLEMMTRELRKSL